MARDSETTKSDRQLLEESLQRARRIETRVTMIANHLGVDAGGEKPTYDPVRRVVQVKTPKVSLEDVLAAIEDDVVMVQVFCGDQFVASVCPA
jgi:hypothetical protein